MKKVGIITFHRALNLGAMLQAYALERTLSEKYESKIIDYRGTKLEQLYYRKKTFLSKVKDVARFILKPKKAKYMKNKKRHFDSFLKNSLNTTEMVYTENNIIESNEEFDAIITGSDQVWNPRLTGDDLNYFLNFVEPNKRYSYAGSFGNKTDIYESKNIKKITELLSSIKKPLIRETSGFDILKNLGVTTWDRAEQVCDPIFLLSKDEWVSNLNLKKNNEDYILLFIVAPETNSYQFAKKMKEQYGYPIKYINSYDSFESCPAECENCMDVGPKEFLELVLNAKVVVTTSFHGMAFSINFNKNFYYELDKRVGARNDRLINLAEFFLLESREIISSDQEILNMDIDYETVNKRLKEYSNNSRSILFTSLKGI